MKKFRIEIVIPEMKFFEGDIDVLVVETKDGELGFLADHAPVVLALDPAVITMKVDGKVMIAANSNGFLTVTPEKTIMLCQTMEWPQDIDIRRVHHDIEKGKRKLSEAGDKIDYEYGQATLKRAYARLRAVNKYNELNKADIHRSGV